MADAETKPYYLKIAVQLYDATGKLAEQGTVEDWWAGPELEKRVFTLPSYRAVEVRKPKEIFRTQGASYPPPMLEALLQGVVHPMPSGADIDASIPEIRKLTLAAVPLECIELGSPIKGLKHIPVGLFPTYCFDPGKTSLRLTYKFGSELLVRNSVGTFQGKSVPIDVAIRSDNVMAATGHITALMSKAIPADEISTSGLTRISDEVTSVAAETVKQTAVSQVQPIYPDVAKRGHISGTVILRAQIGTDGHVEKLRVESSPDPDLALAAVAAVRKWRYRPYAVNGEPVPVDTTVTVNFELR
ncbi:MAG: hypothetical protein NVSMB62_29830 [Acidobacteriaceae bacterium]